MWREKRVSVAFPAFNEEANIGQAVETFVAHEHVDEVVVADNGSTDRTRELAERAGAHVVTESRPGMGHAVRRALSEATGDLILLCEPDGTFLSSDVEKLLLYSDEFEIVLGSRTNRSLIGDGANMGPFLRWGNQAVAKLLALIHDGPSLTDVGCTFRLFRRDALIRILPCLRVGGAHCLPEQVIAALRLGIRLVEIPLHYRPRVGQSKVTGNIAGALCVGFGMIGLILARRLSD